MYARITPYKMKPGSREACTKIVNQLKPQIMALDGMTHFVNVMGADDSGYVIALTTEPEMTPEIQEKVNALWSAFGEFLESTPTVENYDVIVDWAS